MHQETTTRPSAVPIRSGIVTLSGYGISVAVRRRHLAVATAWVGSGAKGASPRRRAGSSGLS